MLRVPRDSSPPPPPVRRASALSGERGVGERLGGHVEVGVSLAEAGAVRVGVDRDAGHEDQLVVLQSIYG